VGASGPRVPSKYTTGISPSGTAVFGMVTVVVPSVPLRPVILKETANSGPVAPAVVEVPAEIWTPVMLIVGLFAIIPSGTSWPPVPVAVMVSVSDA